MNRGRGWKREVERGSVLVEVVFLLVLLTLPVFYLVGTLGRLQAGAYSVSAAAREAGRAYVTAPDQESAAGRALAAAQLVHSSHGFAADQALTLVGCEAEPCLQPGGAVRIAATLQVELPLVPDFLDGVIPTSIELSASHLETVDAFREP